MKQKFDQNKFNEWVQDTQDYSKIDSKEVYVARKSNDVITYCVKVLGMFSQEAWLTANEVYITEIKRLGL